MKSFVTLTDAVTEIVILRSRFIAYAYGIEDESDARDKLLVLRKKHYDATHVCYAYIADTDGNISKSSDDGEPSQSAGAPIMSVISQYRKVLVAVVRYFGGTKLGVGGLIKAYSDAAAAAVGQCEKLQYTLCDIYRLTLTYSDHKKCRRILETGKALSVDYTESVTTEIAVPENDQLILSLTETLGAIPEYEKLESRYITL